MRKAFILLAIMFQVLVLVYMAGDREHILRNGKIIHLRTAPIDPRDMFRGDYVRLNYEISRIPVNKIIDTNSTNELKKGAKIYVILKEGPNGLYEMVNASVKKPDEGFYLRGRIPYEYKHLRPGNPLWINYGIEAYFVQQGKGRKIERRQGGRTTVQIPLEMQIAVGNNGKAIIKGYRWSPLGIDLQVLRGAPRRVQAPDDPKSAKIRLTLANVSDAPLAIVELPEYCSFSLESVARAKKNWVPANIACNESFPADSDIIVLLPQQEKSFNFDFSDERWFVRHNDDVREIGILEWSEQFRIVYRPPNESDCQHLAKQEFIRHGYLPSRVFHGRGQID